MKRIVAIALVVVVAAATAWGQGVGSDATGSGGSAMGSATGSAMGTGSALGSGAGSAMGSGIGSGSGKQIIIIIPPDVQAPEVTAAASPSVVRLGDRFTLFITAKYVPGVEVNLVEPVELGGAFEVKRKLSQDTTNPDGTKTREWQLEVYAWDVGELRVPPLAITFTSQGKAGQVATNSVPVNVTGVLGDLVDDPKLVRGNAAPVRLLSRDWFWLWIGGGAAVALIALIAFLMIRKARKRRVRTLIGTLVASAPTPRRIDMTSERALDQLLAIQRSGVLDRDNDRKRGYAEMVDVIREYLGARYRVATLDLTSYELMRSLSTVAPEDERALVSDWLERCDIVKYGGFRATADDAGAVLEAARQLVIATTRAPGMSPSASGRMPAQSSTPGEAA
ncbi:MAG TPA: BatD family protein [Kofleriaceae bacterium]|nr:BatD family protein [Kofleriaceae bacterium]